MCLAVLLFKLSEEFPLIVAANREELYTRKATEPFEILPGVIASQDPKGKGTWLGVNKQGVVVGLTNGTIAVVDITKRSRGLLVLDALSYGDIEAIDHAVTENATNYNPFNLFYVDKSQGYVTSLQTGKPDETINTILTQGIYIITNGAPNARDSKTLEVSKRLDGIEYEPEKVFVALQNMLSLHQPADNPICLHGPQHGTLSSTIIALHKDGLAKSLYLHANGPPCQTEFKDYSHLLNQ